MKQEGRQHGYRIIDPASLSQQRYVKMVESASTTNMGLFAKVSTKPTNRSKCRKPRCNGCHLHFVCKSKAKAKGTMKLRSIAHETEGIKFSFGASATRVLAYLVDEVGGYDNDDYDNYDYEDRVEKSYNYDYGYSYGYDYDDDQCHDHDDDESSHDIDHDHEHENDVHDGKTDDDEDDHDNDDDAMSFCDVGVCWGHGNDDDDDDDDGWYLVGGLMQ